MKTESVRYEIFHNCPCGDKRVSVIKELKTTEDFQLLVTELN